MGHGNRGDARAEARTGARLAGCAARRRAPVRRAHAGARCSSLLSLAGAVALATHNPNDPSLSTAAGGPPTNWLGSFGAYFSDVLLLLFGLGAALFLPVIAIAGLRMLRLEPAGRIGRGLLLAAIGAVLLGIALGLTSGSSVSGLPAGWGGALGLAAAHGVDRGDRPHPQPADRGPGAARRAAAVRPRRAWRRLSCARPERRRSATGSAACSAASRASAAPRRARPKSRDERAIAAAPPRSKPDRRGRRAGPGDRPRRPRGQAASRPAHNRPWRLATVTSCRRSTCCRRRPKETASRSTAPASSATRACSKPCSRTSTSAATSSKSAPARWSRCTSSNLRAASRPAG